MSVDIVDGLEIIHIDAGNADDLFIGNTGKKFLKTKFKTSSVIYAGQFVRLCKFVDLCKSAVFFLEIAVLDR